MDESDQFVYDDRNMTLIPTYYGYRQADPEIPKERYSETFWEEHGQYLEDEVGEQWYRREIWKDILTMIQMLSIYPVRLVDIGCGQNFLVQYAREEGMNAWGLDPYPRWADVVGSFPSPKSIAKLRALKPTVITAFNVLEHVLDVEAWMEAAVDILPENGLLVAQVPQEGTVLQQALEEKYGHWWQVADHTHYFYPGGLAALFGTFGVAVKADWRTFPMELFDLLGYHYVGDSKVGKRCHSIRMRLEKELGRGGRMILRALWRELGIGREVILFGRA